MSRECRFPFELDDFQKRAILHLENDEHVFVAAHTSAGKTVVAEYAINLAAARGGRAIYTSPIKALSNQKFREFKNSIESVGIVTGDVCVNPDAQCIIVTTEILRTMLYRNDPSLSKLQCVIFDEVHYINDPERGVVWEEVIIMLPAQVSLVMLSATVPNYIDFADWIGRTKQKEVFAMLTLYRPTPLRHFLHANEKSFLLMDSKNRFNTAAYNEMYKSIKNKEKEKQLAVTARAKAQAKGKAQPKQHVKKIVSQKPQSEEAKLKTEIYRLQGLLKSLEAEDKLPVVIFCFSRLKCETYSISMPKLDFVTNSIDRSKIHVFVRDSLATLSEEDRALPQIQIVASLLERGIGVHHGGLLPIVKEVVEILFSRGLVRALFATETFAMGVNMPARSVVFSSVRKHDGRKFRFLLASEYTQMAGRAGRRGLDDFGNVYVFCADDPPDQKELTAMLVDRANPLQSKFRLTFQMILQIAKRSSMEMSDVMSMSFKEAVRSRRLPVMKRDLQRRKRELEGLPEIDCIFGNPTMMEYAVQEKRARLQSYLLHKKLFESQNLSGTVFCPGRVAVVHSLPMASTLCVGVLLRRTKTEGDKPKQAMSALDALMSDSVPGSAKTPAWDMLVLDPPGLEPSMMVDFPLARVESIPQKMFEPSDRISVIKEVELPTQQQCLGPESPNASRYRILREVPLDCISTLCDHVLKVSNEFQNDDEFSTTALGLVLNELCVESKGHPPPLPLARGMRTLALDFYDTDQKQRKTHQLLTSNKCHTCYKKEEHFKLSLARSKCADDIEELSHGLRDESLDLFAEMQLKVQLLKSRNYLDQSGCITLKGRVACELLTSDEITLVEILFSGILQKLTPEELAAVLSCFVYPDKSDDAPMGPTEAVAEARLQIEATHSEIEGEMFALGIRLDTADWWKFCNFGLALAAHEWAKGTSFSVIMGAVENMQEGTIVRAILRLDELVRKMKTASILIGDKSFATKLEATSQIIRRDIVFALSLYLS
eukprot:GHVO01064173.1.p1 GENE.GHVO01064173.1~~GHVO01064173.1.p1  ORF type:complete len:998 (+),score=151.22 GHVO01064173.1:303-3296(+)